jgi:hypothetical protein
MLPGLAKTGQVWASESAWLAGVMAAMPKEEGSSARRPSGSLRDAPTPSGPSWVFPGSQRNSTHLPAAHRSESHLQKAWSTSVDAETSSVPSASGRAASANRDAGKPTRQASDLYSAATLPQPLTPSVAAPDLQADRTSSSRQDSLSVEQGAGHEGNPCDPDCSLIAPDRPSLMALKTAGEDNVGELSLRQRDGTVPQQHQQPKPAPWEQEAAAASVGEDQQEQVVAPDFNLTLVPSTTPATLDTNVDQEFDGPSIQASSPKMPPSGANLLEGLSPQLSAAAASTSCVPLQTVISTGQPSSTNNTAPTPSAAIPAQHSGTLPPRPGQRPPSPLGGRLPPPAVIVPSSSGHSSSESALGPGAQVLSRRKRHSQAEQEDEDRAEDAWVTEPIVVTSVGAHRLKGVQVSECGVMRGRGAEQAVSPTRQRCKQGEPGIALAEASCACHMYLKACATCAANCLHAQISAMLSCRILCVWCAVHLSMMPWFCPSCYLRMTLTNEGISCSYEKLKVFLRP